MIKALFTIKQLSLMIFIFVSVFSMTNAQNQNMGSCDTDQGIFPAEVNNPKICRGGDAACQAKIPATICAFKSRFIEVDLPLKNPPYRVNYPPDFIGPIPPAKPAVPSKDNIVVGPPLRMAYVKCGCIPDPEKHKKATTMQTH